MNYMPIEFNVTWVHDEWFGRWYVDGIFCTATVIQSVSLSVCLSVEHPVSQLAMFYILLLLSAGLTTAAVQVIRNILAKTATYIIDLPYRYGKQVPQKHWQLATRLHGVTAHNTVIWFAMVAKNENWSNES